MSTSPPHGPLGAGGGEGTFLRAGTSPSEPKDSTRGGGSTGGGSTAWAMVAGMQGGTPSPRWGVQTAAPWVATGTWGRSDWAVARGGPEVALSNKEAAASWAAASLTAAVFERDPRSVGMGALEDRRPMQCTTRAKHSEGTNL